MARKHSAPRKVGGHARPRQEKKSVIAELNFLWRDWGEGPSQFQLEVGVALILIVLGGVVMFDSYRTGIGWAAEGPKAGYFPFYLGLLIIINSAVTLGHAVTNREALSKKLFFTWAQYQLVMMVLLPSIIYVLTIPWVGIYATTTLYIGWFMWRIGRYAWSRVLPIAFGIPILVFLTFELWFKVPLPKGPVEIYLGF